MPLRKSIKTPKRYEDELVDPSISMASRERSSINTAEANMQLSSSSQTLSEKSNRPKKKMKASRASANKVPASRSTLIPKNARQNKPDGEEPFSALPSPSKSRVPKNTYTGPQTEFNPDLPPATFPTLDTAKQVQEYEQKVAAEANQTKIDRFSLDSPVHDSSTRPISGTRQPTASNSGRSQRSRAATSSVDSINQRPNVASYGSEHSHPSRPRNSITPIGSDAGMSYEDWKQRSIAREASRSAWRNSKPPESSKNPISEENVEQLQEWAKRTSPERYMAEMETSDEEKVSPIKHVRKPAISRVELWKSLPSFMKVHAVDSVYEQFPDEDSNSIFHRLQLTDRQVVEMTKLINERSARGKNEDAIEAKLHAQVRDFLLHRNGQSLSGDKLQTMLDNTIYRKIEEGNPVIATRRMWRDAKEYLELCGLPGSLLDDEDGPTELI